MCIYLYIYIYKYVYIFRLRICMCVLGSWFACVRGCTTEHILELFTCVNCVQLNIFGFVVTSAGILNISLFSFFLFVGFENLQVADSFFAFVGNRL